MEEEKSNPFENWMNEPMPWGYLEQHTRSELFKRGIFVYDNSVETRDPPHTEFEPRPEEDMLKVFFTKKGKPRFARFSAHADIWIFWAVTQGRYRMNREKQMFLFQGTNPGILKLKFSSANDWTRMEDGFNILGEIIEACTHLFCIIERKLVKYNGTTQIYKSRLENFRNIPEIVQWQSWRRPEHKKQQSRWKYQAKKLGGNKGYAKEAKNIPNEKHSVHRIVQDYHLWLPTVR